MSFLSTTSQKFVHPYLQQSFIVTINNNKCLLTKIQPQGLVKRSLKKKKNVIKVFF